MKKTLKSIAAVLVVLTLCLGLLAGCSGGGVVGTWKVSGGEALGSSVGADQLGDTSSATMTFNADGTVTANGQTGGKWTLDGSKLTISADGASIDYEYDGTNIILNMGFVKVIYSRA